MALIFDAVGVTLGVTRALNGVSASLTAGRITAVLGPNGAGKSTLLRLAAGLIDPDVGTIALNGMAVTAMSPRERARTIGYLPQSASLSSNLDVETLVALGRHPHRSPFAAPAPADSAAVAAAIAATGLTGLEKRPMATLSGGEAARAHLARVLAGAPAWILADEPFANLDPAYQIDLAQRLREAAARGAGVLLVMHDLSLAARIADDALLLGGGRLIAGGTAEKVITPPVLGDAFGIAFVELRSGPHRSLLAARD